MNATPSLFERLLTAVAHTDGSMTAERNAVFAQSLADVRTERGPEANAPGVDDAQRIQGDAPVGAVARVKELLDRTEAGSIAPGDELEASLATVPAAETLREFFAEVEPESIGDVARDAFWAIALSGTRIEAVKWGIIVGTLRPTEQQIEPLLTFSHHAEFTRYALPPLVHVGTQVPAIADMVYEALELTTGYGTVYYVQHLLTDETWTARPDFTARVLEHSMRYGIKSVLAVPLIGSLDVEPIWTAAREDDTAFELSVMLVNALIFDSGGYPADSRVRAFEKVYRSYVSMLRGRPDDVRVWSAFLALSEFLEEPRASDGVVDRDHRREEMERLLTERLDETAVREALADPARRSLALHLIEGRSLSALLPDIVRMGKDGLDPHAAHVLARRGGGSELAYLAEMLPQIVDMTVRGGAHLTSSLAGRNTLEDRLVAEVTAAMGRLGSPAAVTLLKRGAEDRHPWVRAAACDGFTHLPLDKWDDEIRDLIRARLDDQPDFVADEAKRAAKVGGLVNDGDA